MTKARVCISVSPELENLLKRQATEENISVSALASNYLELAIKTRQDLVATQLLGPKLQATIKQEVRSMANRLAHLLARTALTTEANRQLIFQLLVKEFGSETAFRYRDKAWEGSVEGLKKPLKGLVDILKLTEPKSREGDEDHFPFDQNQLEQE